MLPLDIGWSDVGSWSSLWDIAPRDADGNYVHGDAVTEDTHDCYLHSEKALISTIGVSNLIIVETPDALLVADKSRAQDVSKVVARLKKSNRKEQEQHLRNYRPWGYFETMALRAALPGEEIARQARRQAVDADASPPLRALGRGAGNGARHQSGEDEQLVRENESVYIFATQWHRLENPGKVPLESSKCRSAPISARTTSRARTIFTSARPKRRDRAARTIEHDI